MQSAMYWILSLLYLSTFISHARTISCIVCNNLNNSACADPFNAGGVFGTALNQTYCRKSVGVTGVIVRSGTDEMCATSTDIGVTSVYCCSNMDFCNEGSHLYSSSALVLLAVLAAKLF
ncbi:unnamed protein product [Adineta ricciae]|nr:unnamed protein product [Adineta ricciae]